MGDYAIDFGSLSHNDSVTGPSKPAKKPKALSLKKPGKENDPVNESTCLEEDFSVSSEAQYDQLAKGFVPKNTGKCTNWAVNNFNEWCKERNALYRSRAVSQRLAYKNTL